ncbi:hypothetical protein M0802_005934 [Mischocyttarus mexicanus]|nr:hypothetical protein M0802_005934 [Mischocyttarus mexicanus]
MANVGYPTNSVGSSDSSSNSSSCCSSSGSKLCTLSSYD